MPTSLRVRRPLRLLTAAALLAACVRQTPPPAATLAAAPATRLADARDQYVTLGDVRLRYRELGRGEPLVLLHGYSGRLEDLGSLADSLAGGNRVILFDERGFGQSTKFADPARFGRAMGEDVVRLLDALGIRRAHLVGHSMGALVAAYVAVNHPDRVATASLLAGPFYADSATMAAQVRPWVDELERTGGMRDFIRWIDSTTTDSSAAAISASIMSRNDLAAMKAVMRAMPGLAPPGERIRTARVPAVVIVGTDDTLLPQSRDLASRWPGARLVEIPGITHIAVLWHPATLSAVRALIATR